MKETDLIGEEPRGCLPTRHQARLPDGKKYKKIRPLANSYHCTFSLKVVFVIVNFTALDIQEIR